jgi:uncharacterized membrane protein
VVTIHRGEEEQVIVAEPNRSASWRANLQVLVALSILSLGIAGGFAAVGAWPVLPFAGIEITALGCALYYVSWKLRYRHVITLRPDTLQIQKGHFHPRQQWRFNRADTALSVTPERHPWDGPLLHVYSRGESVAVGDFLNREDSLKLLELLGKQRIRIGDHAPQVDREF